VRPAGHRKRSRLLRRQQGAIQSEHDGGAADAVGGQQALQLAQQALLRLCVFCARGALQQQLLETRGGAARARGVRL
jgi:hypothetical protein